MIIYNYIHDYLKRIGDDGNDDNGDVQVKKEEVAAMPMGPLPSRKLTRTPPIYQQQVYLSLFIAYISSLKTTSEM